MPRFTIRPLRLRFALLLSALLATVGVAVAAQVDGDMLGMVSANPLARAMPSPQVRWQTSMAAFAASDRERLPATDGVLFVGSSTIRMWSHLAQDFRQLPVVINRGFGGSTMADCQYFVKQLVLQYKPRQVLVYAGDNDLAEGRTPAQVLESFKGFAQAVRRELPDTRISYISIKPSPLRASLLPQIREANTLLAGYVRSLPNAAYIDTFTPMLDASGAPRTDLFRADRLHMNDAGYALWQSVIAGYIQPTSVDAAVMSAAAPAGAGAGPAPALRANIVSP